MRRFVPAALLLLALVNLSQQLEISSFNPVKKISEVVSDLKPAPKEDAQESLVTDYPEDPESLDEDGEEGPGLSLSPFKTNYYTDYYQDNKSHKLYREVVSRLTNKRLHCTYVGDRDIVAGLIGASNRSTNEALDAVLPKSYVTAVNVTTDEIDNMIDDCINTPIEVPAATKPFLERFLKKLTKGVKNIAAYMFIFPGTKWCGAGDVARTYSDLGPQSATDQCCRDHDHSGQNLERGETLEDLKNPLFYTMTNCDDDNKFHECLRKADTAHAGAVGTMFFNLLKTKCFAKRKEATCIKKLPLSPCQNYTYDENSEEKYQIFDPKKFIPDANIAVKTINDFLFKVPGIDNIFKLF